MSDDRNRSPLQSIGCAAIGLCVPLALFQIVLVVLFSQMDVPLHRLYTWPLTLGAAEANPPGIRSGISLGEIFWCVMLAVLYGFMGTIAVGMTLRNQGR